MGEDLISSLQEDFGIFDGFFYTKPRFHNNKKLKFGINDAPFQVSPKNSIKHPAYVAWGGMLERCFSEKCKSLHPTYSDASCCNDWLLFTNFAKWFKYGYKPGYQLDKDLLVKGNKIYSPLNCVLVPQSINKFMINNSIGKYMLGVTYEESRSKFRSSIFISNRHINLGRFDSEYKAHRAWQKAKLERAIAFNFPPLQRMIDQLSFEIANNLETTSL